MRVARWDSQVLMFSLAPWNPAPLNSFRLAQSLLCIYWFIHAHKEQFKGSHDSKDHCFTLRYVVDIQVVFHVLQLLPTRFKHQNYIICWILCYVVFYVTCGNLLWMNLQVSSSQPTFRSFKCQLLRHNILA